MRKYDLAIFDIDGTLSDSFPWFLRVANVVADKHRFKRIEDNEIESLRSLSAREMIKHLGVPLWRLPLIARDVRAMKSAALGEIPLFAGVPEMLGQLAAQGVVVAVVSSDNEANVRRALGELARHVTHFACGASMFGKAAKFRRVLKAANVPAARAIAIGDEVRDVEAAREAGIDFGAVSWGYTAPDALRRLAPQMMFGAVGEIAPALA